MDYAEFCKFKKRLSALREEKNHPGATWRVSVDWDYFNSPAGQTILGAWWLTSGFFLFRDFFGVFATLEDLAAGKLDCFLVGAESYSLFLRDLEKSGLSAQKLKIEYLGVRDAALSR